MAFNQIQTGAQNNPDGVVITARAGKQGDTSVSELHGRYYEQNYRGNTFGASVATAAAITAYTGGAGGTPQIALYNPLSSGKNAVILAANYANVVAASAAGTVTWGLYYGPTAAITAAVNGTALNMSALRATNSQMQIYTNTALTSSTALSNVLPLGSYYWATAAGATLVTQTSPADIGGLIIVPPGSMIALGGSSALTSATWIGAMYWEEVPV